MLKPSPALVTVGVPTFDRPHLLPRALESLAQQTYPNFVVVVSDNATAGEEVSRVIESFRGRLAQLELVRHQRNIGILPNLFSLLDRASGEYFMWLADDDEISPSFIASAVATLDADPDAVTAAGHWRLMTSQTDWRDMPTSSFPQGRRVSRVWRFVWRADDAFFYGLHRLTALRRATYKPFGWPNRNRIRNWAYPFLLDLVIDGKILLVSDPAARFINHDYTAKKYVAGSNLLLDIACSVMRRINVHLFYLEKILRRCGITAAVALVPVSLASLFGEAGRGCVALVAGAMRRARRLAKHNRA